MNIWNWFLTKIGRRFPYPPRHILNFKQIHRYWYGTLNHHWRRQCSVIVLRVRRSSTAGSNVWKSNFLPSISFIAENFLEREPGDSFTIRIDREYELQPGMKKKEEVCIANFEL